MTTPDRTIFEALDRLETKLSATIATGHLALTQQINTIYDLHHKAQLEQERRNSQFVTADRLASLTEALGQLQSTSNRNAGRIDALADACDEQRGALISLRAELHSDTQLSTNRQIGLFTTVSGWLVMAALVLIGPLVSVLLTHLVH